MTVLITGANKGIGFQNARLFAKNNYNSDIIITSRNEALGQEALKKLSSEFPKAKFVYHQLDITDPSSRNNLINFIKSKYQKLDILVNNAGMAYKCASEAPFSEQAEVTNTCNYYGTKSLTVEMLGEGLFDNNNSRVLFCSSLCSDTSYAKCSKSVQNALKNDIKTVEELDDVVNDFIDLAEDNTSHTEKYSNSAYGMSKVFVRKLCYILAENPNYGSHIKFYSYCPGWCKTDMAGYEKPPLTAEEGAQISYWLGTTQDEVVVENNGGYFRNGDKLCQWGYVDGE